MMNKIVAFFKRLFVQNWKMKLIAFVFAFILWSFVIAENNPSKTKIFYDIPVTFTAADELRQKGLAPTEPLSDILKTATVTAQTPAKALQYLNENMIQASVDLSAIDGAGTYTLKVEGKTTFSDGNIVSVEPSTVTVTVEEMITKEVPVEVQLTGEKSDGLYYGEPVITPENITIKGARSNVDEVAKAVCTIDVTGITEPATASYSLTYMMADSETTVPSSLFTGNASVIVELPVYPVKEVPIDIESVKSTTKGLAAGYQIINVSLDPQTVKVAGKQEDIDKITSVSLEPITLDQAAEDAAVEANVVLPDGVVATVPSKVQVKFTISQPEIEKEYAGKKIAYKNLGDGLDVQIDPASIDIKVYGTQEAYNTFTSSMLKPFVDLSGLGKGVHTGVPIKFENEPDLGVRPVPTVATVTVTIS